MAASLLPSPSLSTSSATPRVPQLAHPIKSSSSALFTSSSSTFFGGSFRIQPSAGRNLRIADNSGKRLSHVSRVTAAAQERIPVEEVFEQLKCTKEGLSSEEGANRLQIFGPNKLEEKKAVALILGVIGIYTAFKFHNESGIANLYSLHSWIGIGVISLYAIQWIYGFIIFFYPGGSTSLRNISLPWHVLFGAFVHTLAIATVTLGFLEKLTFLESSGFAKYGTEAFLVNSTTIVSILYGTAVIFVAFIPAPVEDESRYTEI